jgi:hypothetical protein
MLLIFSKAPYDALLHEFGLKSGKRWSSAERFQEERRRGFLVKILLGVNKTVSA